MQKAKPTVRATKCSDFFGRYAYKERVKDMDSLLATIQTQIIKKRVK